MAIQIQPPFVVIPVAIATIAVCALLGYIAGPVYGEQEIKAQIASEDSSLCGKFGLAAGTPEAAQCVVDLADLRRRHEILIASNSIL
jgi:hypothetical protein